MGKYLKKFENHSDYETYIGGQGAILPNVSLCKQQNEVHYNPYIDYSNEYLTFVALEDETFQLSKNGASYSLDNGETWTELAAATATPTVTAGNKIMWKGALTPSSSYSSMGIGTFSATGNFNAQGNPMSLLFGDNFKGQADLTGKSYAFCQLFYQNTRIVNANNLSLPATTLARVCYSNMFNGCTNLITTPILPATTLAEFCYQSMFSGCTSLTAAPELPATTLAASCYSDMFRGCTGLTTAPELPATTLAQSCYAAMFINCTSLIMAPELLTTTLASFCYQYMFYGCTSLVTAPELPATTLANQCYDSMFKGCTNLNYIKAMFTTTPSFSYTDNWVNGVSVTGTFVKNAAAQWDMSGANGIPTGWAVQTASE